jgi:hypothetical protein
LRAIRHEIGLAGSDDMLSELRIDDEPDRHRLHRARLSHRRREGRLEARPRRFLGERHRPDDAAGRAVENVDARFRQGLGEADRVLDLEPALDIVDRRGAVEERLVARPDLADGAADKERKAHAVFRGCPEFVGPPIGDR